MSFHPDNHLPECMLPDGGSCCKGHAALCEDWHRLRAENERLRGEIKNMTTIERKNLRELVAVLRTFPVEEIAGMRLGQQFGHYIGLAWMTLMQRRVVLEALDRVLEDRALEDRALEERP